MHVEEDLPELLSSLQIVDAIEASGTGSGGAGGRSSVGSGTSSSARRVAPGVLAVPRGKAANPAGSAAPSGKSCRASSSACGGKSAEPAAPPPARSAPKPASGRHNVGRVPELDYFARKLEDSELQALKWQLKYGKAGQALGGLPDVHASPSAYLTAMQAHTALEFQAAAASALEAAKTKDPLPAQKWWPFEKTKKGGSVWAAQAVAGRNPSALDFSKDGDPWVKHLVHVRETDSFHVAKLAKRNKETQDDIIVLLPTVEVAGQRCHMRSLGYMGSFLLAYSSAQDLHYQLSTGTLRPGARLMLDLATDPRKKPDAGSSTLRPLHLLPDVPLNDGQRKAVEGLGPGLSIIHGPPGTGKSTTIFHIIEGRVQPKAQVLVTATRNQAIDAVVSKLSLVEGSILVFGREERLGPHAKRYQLEERVKRHPDVAAWEKHAARLEELRRAGGARPATVVSALQAALVQANGAPDEQLRKLRRDLEKLRQVQPGQPGLVKDLQAALNRIQGGVLPEVRQRAERIILESTRVYACTVDSTPGMVGALAECGVKVRIDTVIVDEAGCVPEMAIPVLIRLAPSQLVLVGDHLQLPAFTDLHKPPPNHTRSLMQRAVKLEVLAAMLTEQYRMHPSICAAVSKEFYDGRLTTASAACERSAVASPCRLVHVQGWEQQQEGGGYWNEIQAYRAIKVAVKAAGELRGIGVSQPTVYLISLYNKQRDLLAKLVRHSAKLRAACSCQVLSVDACQGDEADAVIVSTVRTQKHLSSFFRDRQRINVALSRARHLCIVVGDRSVLALPKAQPWGSVLASYTGWA